MTKARRLEGPCAPLFYSAAALLLLSGMITTAQTVDISTLEQCAGLETEERKLACFEAIIAADKTPQTPEAGAVETPVAEQPAALAAVLPVVAETPESSPAVAATSVATVTVVADSEFGQEQLALPEEKDEDNEIIRARVIDVTQDNYKVLYFHLDDGHVWRQKEPRHYEYPNNGEFDITISRGMMGEYRMRIGDNGKMVRIRRVQ
jgi:hypothetical protein